MRATPIMLVQRRPRRRALVLAAALLSFVFLFALWRTTHVETASAPVAHASTARAVVAPAPSSVIEARPDTDVLAPVPGTAAARDVPPAREPSLVSARPAMTPAAATTDDAPEARDTTTMVARRSPATIRTQRGANGSLILD